MNCITCGGEMPDERGELGFFSCIRCSDQSVYVGAPQISHKTGHDINMIKNSPQNKAIVDRAFNLGNCIIRRATPKNRRKK